MQQLRMKYTPTQMLNIIIYDQALKIKQLQSEIEELKDGKDTDLKDDDFSDYHKSNANGAYEFLKDNMPFEKEE